METAWNHWMDVELDVDGIGMMESTRVGWPWFVDYRSY